MSVRILVLAVALSLVLCGVGVAELYRWVDEKGAVHFSDEPPRDPCAGAEVKSIPTPKYRSPPANQSAYGIKDWSGGGDEDSQGTRNQTSRQAPEVELYTTSWCGYCGKARDYFLSRGISFREYDIERDESAARRKRSLDPRRGVPFAVVNGQAIHGFSPTAYARALEMTP